jgi:Zn finger protein HypA/HybF involved in hydrogenase expression
MTNQPKKKFQKKIEDFACEKCGQEVKGTGYTNHCPNCLWSKHVDVNPGDRADDCGGMMCPVKLVFEKGEFVIVHKCEKCNIEKRKVLEKKDNFDAALNVAKKSNI